MAASAFHATAIARPGALVREDRVVMFNDSNRGDNKMRPNVWYHAVTQKMFTLHHPVHSVRAVTMRKLAGTVR
jgi:hypothetical protein